MQPLRASVRPGGNRCLCACFWPHELSPGWVSLLWNYYFPSVIIRYLGGGSLKLHNYLVLMIFSRGLEPTDASCLKQLLWWWLPSGDCLETPSFLLHLVTILLLGRPFPSPSLLFLHLSISMDSWILLCSMACSPSLSLFILMLRLS